MCFQVATFNPPGINSASLDSFLIRAAFLLGASFAALLHLGLKFDSFRPISIYPINTPARLISIIPGFIFCFSSFFSFIIGMPAEIVCLLWFVAGIGSTFVSFSWMDRFSLFDRTPSFTSVGVSYLFASFLMLFSISMDGQRSLFLFVEMFPLISCLFFFLACRRFDFPSEKPTYKISLRNCFELDAFKTDIPDKKTRKILLQKLIFSLIYSFFFGYLACLGVSDQSSPFLGGGGKSQ